MVARRACAKIAANQSPDRPDQERDVDEDFAEDAGRHGRACCASRPRHHRRRPWPQKPIRFIVPFPAGGGTDVVARLVAKNLQDKLGQTIIVENRGGANGAIGLMAVKQSVADGYTFAFTSDTPMTVNLWLYKDLSYQPLKDFVPVSSAVRLPGMLAAHPSFPANTIAELIALAKEKPGSINYASAGVGNFSHLAMELFRQGGRREAAARSVQGHGSGRPGAALGRGAGRLQQRADDCCSSCRRASSGRSASPSRSAFRSSSNYPAVAETVPNRGWRRGSASWRRRAPRRR